MTGKITLKPKDTEILRQRRLDALMVAITENPLPDDFLSNASRQNNPPKNPLEYSEKPLIAKGTAKTKDPK